MGFTTSLSINSSNRKTWESLQGKIDDIISLESKEKSLLQDLVGKRKEKSTTTATTTVGSLLEDADGEGDAEAFSISSSSIAQNHVVTKLLENSKRMESMVGMLVDLKSVLSSAVTTQEKQMALRTEVVELRDEISYLR
jgi:hypothetical protein